MEMQKSQKTLQEKSLQKIKKTHQKNQKKITQNVEKTLPCKKTLKMEKKRF